VKDHKSLIIAIIGQPNAGKSSLLNRIIGEKIAIVTHKVQTTRFNIKGIYNHEKTQLVFIDTPGIFDPKETLEKAIVKNALNALYEADLICLLIDGNRFIQSDIDEAVLKHLKSIKKPIYAVINKIDLLPRKQDILPLINKLTEYNLFKEYFPLSALNGEGVEHFIKFLLVQALDKPWLYIDDEITDQPLRNLCEEITREQAFTLLHQEIPYSLKIETEKWEETENEVRIYQAIFALKNTQKSIILGKAGSKIKEIGRQSTSGNGQTPA